jgi:4-carboxymuconolactone decarboxylase
MPDHKKTYSAAPANGRIPGKKRMDPSPKKTEFRAKKSGPRLRPVPMSEIRDDWAATLARIPGSGLKGKFFPGNVLGTLMHNPRTLGTFLDYWVTSKSEMGFSVREQELIILRMGVLYKCDYVWRHHVPVAREFGVSEKEIAAVRKSPLPGIFTVREATLLRLTDELVVHRTVRKKVWDKCGRVLSRSEWIDMITIVSQYVLFALVNNSFEVQLERPLFEIPAL